MVASHPGYQAAEMKELEVPLPGTDAGGVLGDGLGDGLGSTSSQDEDGAAVTRDAARAERKREVSMLGTKPKE